MKLGVSVEKMWDFAHCLWLASPLFSDAERAVLELAQQNGTGASDVTEALRSLLHKHWDDGQLLEITAVITTFIMIGRVGDSLGTVDPVYFKRPVGIAA